jgi:hypothetical protein
MGSVKVKVAEAAVKEVEARLEGAQLAEPKPHPAEQGRGSFWEIWRAPESREQLARASR